MAYDGIITYAIACELNEKLVLGKIEKVYQPGPEELLLHIHTKDGNVRLFISCNSMSARLCLTENKYENPEQPPTFCMLMRKHIQAGRITDVRQKDSERIVEIDIEAQNELGFNVCKRLIVEIMGKHSNIVLVDIESGKVIDAIKRISIDVNRYRQLLPGLIYEYPPEQDKVGFHDVTMELNLPHDERALINQVAGVSPAIAREFIEYENPSERLMGLLRDIEDGNSTPKIYLDDRGAPIEFHVTTLQEYDGCEEIDFDSVSECVEYFFSNRDSSNMVRQKSMPLLKVAQSALDKSLLKKQKLSEDLLKAENSDKYQLYGELLTANLHLVKPGAKSAVVVNYYDNQEIEIPLDEKISAAKNAQRYFKKYSKAKTAIHEKQSQLEDNERDIEYLESVVQNVEAATSVEELEAIRDELEQTGYVRRRQKAAQRKKKSKPMPARYILADGTTAYIGHNNIENDYLTMKFAAKTDVWMHTKDIPGSHLILKLDDGRNVDDLPAELIYEAAAIAAYHSKAKESDNVPVDYVPIRYVKKPNGAKPGMVIFTHNQTVYVKPQEGKIDK